MINADRTKITNPSVIAWQRDKRNPIMITEELLCLFYIITDQDEFLCRSDRRGNTQKNRLRALHIICPICLYMGKNHQDTLLRLPLSWHAYHDDASMISCAIAAGDSKPTEMRINPSLIPKNWHCFSSKSL